MGLLRCVKLLLKEALLIAVSELGCEERTDNRTDDDTNDATAKTNDNLLFRTHMKNVNSRKREETPRLYGCPPVERSVF